MWTCKKCNETNADDFDTCWSCKEHSQEAADQLSKYKNESLIQKLKSPLLRMKIFLNLTLLCSTIGVIVWMGEGPGYSSERTVAYMFTYIFIASLGFLIYLNKK